MKEKEYKRLSFEERLIIETLLQEERTKSYIASYLNLSRSTITREINKWCSKPYKNYKAQLADWNAQEDYLNKRNQDKISIHKRLRIYVFRGLLKGWSPEQISGRIKEHYPNDPIMRISYESIYRYIYAHRQAKLNLKLIELLQYRRTRRKVYNGSKKRKIRITDQVSIDQRPAHIETRNEAGHWEGDLMIGVKQNSAIGTIVERKTRYTCIVHIKDRKSATVRKAFTKKLMKFSPTLRKSMTYDNGMEMAQHKLLTLKTGIDVYFAHPYSSWERGTNENTNGLIRRFFPKGTDFKTVTESKLQEVEYMLNNRPRKILGYKTPSEAMALEYEKLASKQTQKY
jgi:IS30 family transposase